MPEHPLANLMDLVFAYLAGLLTLINPCVLPVLPIVLATALQASALGPIALAAGMGISFVTVGIAVVGFGQLIGVNSDSVAQLGALVMVGFGLVILLPRLSSGFSRMLAGTAGRADQSLDQVDRHTIAGQFIGGLLLGIVWSPCVGPTLGGAIALASQGENLTWAGLIMTAFAFGVATIIIATAYSARNLLKRHRDKMQVLSRLSQPLIGAVFILVGTTLYFKLHHPIESWALDTLPEWLILLSVSI